MPRSITTERSKDRVRQQRRRDNLAAAKAPTTHTINRAMVEALMQCVEINRRDGVHRMLTPVTLNEVLPRAMAILTLGFSAASSYDVDQVKRVVRERAGKQPDRFTIDDVTKRLLRDDITG
jgi:hypothetical protein